MAKEKKGRRKGKKVKKEKERKKEVVKERKKKQNIWKITTGILAILLVGAIGLFLFKANTWPVCPALTKEKGGEETSLPLAPETKVVEIVEYSDFQCPFSKRAWPTVKQLKEEYGDKIKVLYKHYPLNFHKNAQKAAEASECARDQGKFWEYHDKLFENSQADGTGLNIEDLKKYAQELGLDTKKFNECLDSGEKTSLVQEDFSEGERKGVQGTPTFFINGEKLVGAQPIEKFREVIDRKLKGGEETSEKTEETPDPPFNIVVINDKNCSYCDTEDILAITRQLFPTAKIKEIDFSEAEAKKLIQELNIEVLPAYIFDSEVEKTKSWKMNIQMRNAFEKVNGKYKLKPEVTRATYYVDEEKRANYEKELAEKEKKIKEALGLKEGDNKPQIDFFVMSYCPYGNQAEEALEKVFQNLKDKAYFNPHYVIYSNYRGGGPDYCLDNESKYCSLHGIQELNQDIRELCVKKHLGTEEFFKFALAMNKECNAGNADTCWENVAKKLNLTLGIIKKCQKEEGLELAKKEKELNELLGVSGSPTVFIEGKEYRGARTSQGYQAALCAEFEKKPKECGKVITETSPSIPSGGCGS